MYDLIIIGAGAAGYTAAIYAARYKMKVLVIGMEIGGNTAKAYEIENYPGFPKILGRELMVEFKKHAENLQVEIKQEFVSIIDQKDNYFEVQSSTSGILKTKTILLATGTHHRKLNAEGEKNFYGKGISYCATCDGYFFKDKIVAIIGGGDAAATAGLFLKEICKQVFIIFRKPAMRAEPFWIDRLQQANNVEMMSGEVVQEFIGNQKIEKVLLKSGKEIVCDGVFIQIGSDPEISLAQALNIELNERKYIKVDHRQETNIPGIFAAGDVTDGSNQFEQIITAGAEGAIAANAIFMNLQK